MKKFIIEKYKKYGKKGLIFYGAYLVLKWTLVLTFGKYLVELF
jgi:hypothetical protein